MSITKPSSKLLLDANVRRVAMTNELAAQREAAVLALARAHGCTFDAVPAADPTATATADPDPSATPAADPVPLADPTPAAGATATDAPVADPTPTPVPLADPVPDPAPVPEAEGVPRYAETPPCASSFASTLACTRDVAGHPRRKIPYGCGRYECANEVCQKKCAQKRARHAWAEHFAHVPGTLLHLTVTVPSQFWPRITLDVAIELQKRANALAESWFRDSFALAAGERVFGLGFGHPAGDAVPDRWMPHFNTYLATSVLRPDGTLRSVGELPRGARAELRRRWAAAVGAALGVPAPTKIITHVSELRDARDRQFGLATEVRGFPGWDTAALARLRWFGAFGCAVWGAVRAQLGIAPPEKRGCVCHHRDCRGGEICGAPLADFVALPADQRAASLAVPGTRKNPAPEPFERTFHEHAATADGRPCTCTDCRRADRVLRHGVSAGLGRARRATLEVFEFAGVVALALGDLAMHPGGSLRGALLACWAAKATFEAEVENRTLTVEKAKAYREPAFAFLALADQLRVDDPPTYRRLLSELDLPDVPERSRHRRTQRAKAGLPLRSRKGEWRERFEPVLMSGSGREWSITIHAAVASWGPVPVA